MTNIEDPSKREEFADNNFGLDENFSCSQCFEKIVLMQQTRKNMSLFGKGLKKTLI